MKMTPTRPKTIPLSAAEFNRFQDKAQYLREYCALEPAFCRASSPEEHVAQLWWEMFEDREDMARLAELRRIGPPIHLVRIVEGP